MVHRFGQDEHGDGGAIGDLDAKRCHDRGGCGSAGDQHRISLVGFAGGGLDAGGPAAVDRHRGLAGVDYQLAAAGVEFLRQEFHQVRQAHPAFTRVEDGVFRHGAGVDTRGYGCYLGRWQQFGVIADGFLIFVAGFGDGPLASGVPHEPAAELQPLPAGIGGEERAVAVHAGEAELVVRGGAFSGGVQPGERPAGGLAGEAVFGQQDRFWKTVSRTPASEALAMSASPWADVVTNGLSTTTWRPRPIAVAARSKWVSGGVQG